jgi:hypothetical protein
MAVEEIVLFLDMMFSNSSSLILGTTKAGLK